MSILIKGLDMPESCCDCLMCYDQLECVVGHPYIGFGRRDMDAEPFDFCSERHPRCPAAPVPPHGRLIDADALMARLEKYHPPLGIAMRELADAPTVIQAEEGVDEKNGL